MQIIQTYKAYIILIYMTMEHNNVVDYFDVDYYKFLLAMSYL